MKIYQYLAQEADRYIRVSTPGANYRPGLEADVLDGIEKLVKNKFPSGAGFDAGTKLDLGRSTGEKLVFTTSFHHMDEHGGYDGWTEHTITVKPSMQFDFDLKVSGRDRNGIKDYIAEQFDYTLGEEYLG